GPQEGGEAFVDVARVDRVAHRFLVPEVDMAAEHRLPPLHVEVVAEQNDTPPVSDKPECGQARHRFGGKGWGRGPVVALPRCQAPLRELVGVREMKPMPLSGAAACGEAPHIPDRSTLLFSRDQHSRTMHCILNKGGFSVVSYLRCTAGRNNHS